MSEERQSFELNTSEKYRAVMRETIAYGERATNARHIDASVRKHRDARAKYGSTTRVNEYVPRDVFTKFSDDARISGSASSAARSHGSRGAGVSVGRSAATDSAQHTPKRSTVVRGAYHGLSQFNWLRLFAITFVCVVMLTVSVYYYFTATESGRYTLASWGRVSTPDAYAALGRQHLREGYIRKAVDALLVAYSLSPTDMSVLLDLGDAYESGDMLEEADLAYRRAIRLAPSDPVPYKKLARLFEERAMFFEQVALLEYAFEKTGDDSFDVLLRETRPDYPRVSAVEGYYATPINLTLTTTTKDAEIRYTLDGSEPYFGEVYDGGVYLDERDDPYVLRAVTVQNGKVSEEQTQTYFIRTAAPAMPKVNLASGTYDSVRTVSLRAAADVVAIYYTTDNTQATAASKLYTGSPIVLRKGKTVLRAIAVSASGKISNEMSVTYVCNGKVKSSLLEKDTFDGLTLFSTTRNQFEAKYGKPNSVLQGGTDSLGSYTYAYYDFGYVAYLDGDEQLLAELVTSSETFKGPRGVQVGMTLSDVIALFRDEGGEEDAEGNRVLYKLTNGNQGYMNKISEYNYEVKYYTKLERDFIEFTIIFRDDEATRLEWLRYRP